MKNIKRLLVATVALLSVGSMATVQPGVPVSEDAPIRITTGLGGALFHRQDIAAGVFGANEHKAGVRLADLSFGLGFAHNVGYDFEYGLGIKTGWANPRTGIFTEAGKDNSGMRLDIELMLRFMPELAEKFHFGGLLGLGWGRQWGEGFKDFAKRVAFGDFAFKAGLGLSYGLSDMVALYFTPAYTFTNVRWASGGADAAEATANKAYIKDSSNLSGVEAPVGLWVSMSDNVGLFLDVNTQFVNFKKFKDSWKEDFTLGVSFAL
jgi:hypothetical protein